MGGYHRYVPIIAGDRSWIADANCAGVNPAVFFPERGEDTKPAKQVCAGCEVRAACLDYALAHGIKHGIWGGESERARRGMRRFAS